MFSAVLLRFSVALPVLWWTDSDWRNLSMTLLKADAWEQPWVGFVSSHLWNLTSANCLIWFNSSSVNCYKFHACYWGIKASIVYLLRVCTKSSTYSNIQISSWVFNSIFGQILMIKYYSNSRIQIWRIENSFFWHKKSQFVNPTLQILQFSVAKVTLDLVLSICNSISIESSINFNHHSTLLITLAHLFYDL